MHLVRVTLPAQGLGARCRQAERQHSPVRVTVRQGFPMQVLGERSTSGTDSGAPTDSQGRPDENARPGRRRGARVRARGFVSRPKRARRSAWDIAALKLPDPLLTGPMAVADGPSAELGTHPHSAAPTDPADPGEPGGPGGPGDPGEQLREDDALGDTAEWHQQPVHAIDLSDRPKLIVRPDPEPPLRPTFSSPPATFVPAPIVPAPVVPAPVVPDPIP